MEQKTKLASQRINQRKYRYSADKAHKNAMYKHSNKFTYKLKYAISYFHNDSGKLKSIQANHWDILKDYNYNAFPIPHERALYNWYYNGKIEKYSVQYKRKRNNSSYGKTAMPKDILKKYVHQRTEKYNFGIHDYCHEHRYFEIYLVEGSYNIF